MTLDKFEAAAACLKGIIRETPLMHSDVFSAESNNDVYIKPENLQLTGAFKIRGAYNRLFHMTEDEKAHGIVAASAGNHAQGVAYSANRLGIEATIVMPSQTPLIKVEATRNYGAKVVLYGDCYDDAYEKALEIQKEHKATLVHPFDDPMVIAGQGTVGMEILDALDDVDVILVPIGGGGLISGIASVVKALRPSVKVIGVEPEGAQTLSYSLHKNKVSELKVVSTIAEGVAVKKPGETTFELVRDYVDDIIVVSDVDVLEAFLLMVEKEKMVAENAGVLSLAALKKLPYIGKKIVCVVSGGNIDVVTISEMINRGLISRGRLFCFSVELHDTPGELLKISTIMAKHNANVIQLDHNQFKTLDRFMHVQLEITLETNGHEHVADIKKALYDEGYQVTVVY